METFFDSQPSSSSFVKTQSAFPVPLCSLFLDEKEDEQNNWFCFDDFFPKEVQNFKVNFLWKVFAPLFNQSLTTISNQQHLSFRFLTDSLELTHHFHSEKSYECETRSVILSRLQMKRYREYCALEKEFSMTISANQKFLSIFLQRLYWTEKKFREDLFAFYFYEIQGNHCMRLKKELQTLVFQKEETILTLWFAENEKILGKANQNDQTIEEKEKQNINKNVSVATKDEVNSQLLSDSQKNFFLSNCEEEQDPDSLKETKRKVIEDEYEQKICSDIQQHIFLIQQLKSIESSIQNIQQSQQSIEKELKTKEGHRMEFAHFFNEKVTELHSFDRSMHQLDSNRISKNFWRMGRRKKTSIPKKENGDFFFRSTQTQTTQ